MIKVEIRDPKTKRSAVVINGNEEINALVTATRPLKTFVNDLRYFINEDYGAAMNQDASVGGTPEKVHDGTDSALWNATDIVGGGRTTFNSADQNHTAAGAKSVKVDDAPVGDVFQFDKGADLDCNGYVSLSLWIYVDKNWKLGDSVSIYGWDTGTGLQVGTEVFLEDYFNWASYDEWQKISIPLIDFGDLSEYTTLDALRIRQVADEGKAPKYYLDDIQFEETGDPIKFSIKPELGTWLHVSSLQMQMADAYTGVLADSTMLKIPYNGFLGLSKLITGILYKRETAGKIVITNILKQFLDFMALTKAKITGSGSDGTNTWVTMETIFTEPVVLKSEDDDEMSLTLNDDMSELLEFRVGAGCKIEQRC